jgi:hypothetical protein
MFEMIVWVGTLSPLQVLILAGVDLLKSVTAILPPRGGSSSAPGGGVSNLDKGTLNVSLFFLV